MAAAHYLATSQISLLLLLLFFCCFTLPISSGFVATDTPKLHPQEVQALKVIGEKIGKKDWDFGLDPCSGRGNWSVSYKMKGFASNVSCNCTSNSTGHVSSIELKAQNLSGIVPPEFSKLPCLQILDLSRNCLTGSIPPQWATLRLFNLSFMGNRLSGPFPKVLTSISTLRNLSIEGNNFSGPIPPEIGKLINLEALILSSNAFSGELPLDLSKLVNLTDMRISDTNLTGKLPDYISNWTKVQKLHIQGNSLEGPIPRSISALENLSDLRISDLKGKGSPFPDLSSMKQMKRLILRNCLLFGEIPKYVGSMTKLKMLDVSFNNLTGKIPSTFSQLAKVDYMYLTGNKLTGPVPKWMLERNKNTDISDNNFTWEGPGPNECSGERVNLVESYASSTSKSSKMKSCLKQNFPCSSKPRYYSLHINCGGDEAIIGDHTTYESNIEQGGASMFYTRQNWALSSTGNFMDDNIDSDSYILTNTSAIANVSAADARLYTTARVSPMSLTYYGLCLLNGNYTVNLHFAEILFTNDNTFQSLGKRIFDIYIQGKLALEDFNIAEEAGGSGRPIMKTFPANVTSNTLEIRFYWAGRGTTGIPDRGTYGPLVSAISVDPNFTPPSDNGNRNAIIAATTAAAAVSIVLLILGIFWKRKVSEDRELKGLDLQTGIFTLKQIKAATENFDAKNKVGEGGFGSVYKGLLSDGSVIAVKRLSSKSKQGKREFVNEIGMISALQHPNLVKLYGCCVEGDQLMLVYEYMENNCLSRALFGKNPMSKLKLDWPTRRKICLGVARGLTYLHEESTIKVVHRDIKASNVLLDKGLNAKISDFGLAKLSEEDDTHISTRVAGTFGYMAPEYAMRGYLTSKADTYSFGVVALEIVSGKSNTNYRPKEESVYLLDWAYVLQERGSLLELVDPELGSDYSLEEAMVMLNVALLCTNAAPTLRPTMSQVVSMLEGQTAVHLLSDPGFTNISPKYNALRKHFLQNTTANMTYSLSTDSPVTDSSSSYVVG